MIRSIRLAYHRFSCEFHMFFFLLLNSELSKTIADQHCEKYNKIEKKP